MVSIPIVLGKSILKMLRLKFWGVVVDGDDIKTNGPVVVDEFLVLGCS